MRSPERTARRTLSIWCVGLALTLALTALPACGLFDSKVDVLLIGDSIMRQSGEYVEDTLEARPDIEGVEVKNAGKNGSGLLTPGTYDWHEEAAGMIEKYDPDIVVVLFIGNYTSDDLYRLPDGTPVEGYTPEWFQAWGVEGDRLMEVITAGGADVWWVQPPPMIDGEGARRVEEMRATYQALVDRWPATGLIDGTAALAGPDGRYAESLPDENGQMQAVRVSDTVHLTPYGSQLMADAISDAIGPPLAALMADDGGG
jgi:hypothetical protein